MRSRCCYRTDFSGTVGEKEEYLATSEGDWDRQRVAVVERLVMVVGVEAHPRTAASGMRFQVVVQAATKRLRACRGVRGDVGARTSSSDCGFQSRTSPSRGCGSVGPEILDIAKDSVTVVVQGMNMGYIVQEAGAGLAGRTCSAGRRLGLEAVVVVGAR